MTLGEFRRKTENLPDNMDMFLEGSLTEFDNGLITDIEVKEIGFSGDPYSKPLCYDTVIILKEG